MQNDCAARSFKTGLTLLFQGLRQLQQYLLDGQRRLGERRIVRYAEGQRFLDHRAGDLPDDDFLIGFRHDTVGDGLGRYGRAKPGIHAARDGSYRFQAPP